MCIYIAIKILVVVVKRINESWDAAFQIKLKIVQMSHAWEELRATAKAAETRVRNIV